MTDTNIKKGAQKTTNWSLHLKALYDDFPSRSIWMSDSSSLVLRSGVGDLSRRYAPVSMPLLLFRKFLTLKTGASYPLHDPFSGYAALPISPTPELPSLFRKYRTMGTRPFYAENAFQERMLAVLDKTLYADWKIEAVRDETTANFVIRDDSDYLAANAIPLWLLGFMY